MLDDGQVRDPYKRSTIHHNLLAIYPSVRYAARTNCCACEPGHVIRDPALQPPVERADQHRHHFTDESRTGH